MRSAEPECARDGSSAHRDRPRGVARAAASNASRFGRPHCDGNPYVIIPPPRRIHRRVPTRIAPLAITAFTATSALGHGLGAHADALCRDRGGLTANDFTRVPLPCAIGRVAGLESMRAAATRSPSTTAATTGSPGAASTRMDFSTRRATAIERHGADRVALVVGTSTSSDRRDRRGLSRARRRSPAGAPAPAGAAHAAFARAFPRSRARHARAVPHGRDRVLVEREDLRQGRAHDPARHRPTPRSSPASIRCATACCSASTRSSSFRRAVPAVRPGAQRHLDRRSGRLRAASSATAMRARRGSIGYGESSDAYHMSTPHPEGRRRTARARRRARTRGHSSRTTSTTSICTARRRRRTTRSKRRCSPTFSPVARARQRDERLHRPHARRGRHPRSRDHADRDGTRLRAGDAEQPRRRAGLRARSSRSNARSARSASRSATRSASAAATARSRSPPARRTDACDALTVYVDGIGFWAPGIRGLGRAAARARRRRTFARPKRHAKPSPAILPPTERRRAPEPVLLASEAAGQAARWPAANRRRWPACSRRRTAIWRSPTQMCATLAADPRELSPTRFHNSVHNAPAGYWTVAAHCHKHRDRDQRRAPAASRRASSKRRLEVAAEGDAVLLAAYDIAARGPLAEVAPSGVPFAAAFVLSPSRSAASLAQLSARRTAGHDDFRGMCPHALAAFATNPTAVQALPLLVALAQRVPAKVTLASGAQHVARDRGGAVSASDPRRVAIVIPALNEERAIRGVVESVLAISPNVIVDRRRLDRRDASSTSPICRSR